MRNKIYLAFTLFIFCFSHSYGQNNEALPKGNLFIIGGGSRSPQMIQQLIQTAQLNNKDHIVVLPMSGEEPDTSFYYIKTQLEKACSNIIANLNFTVDKVDNQQWLDSLKTAKLIFITGGDQTRFMKVVEHTKIFDAIHFAYNNGSTVSGTSAGAAVMSKIMITGNQLLGDTTYEPTFDKLWNGNIEFSEGLGLITNAIIDQHFIARSRYNRLLSALAVYPQLPGIGIDEATAIIVHQNKITVTGESQVVLMSQPKGIEITKDGLIKFKQLSVSIYTAGDVFEIK